MEHVEFKYLFVTCFIIVMLLFVYLTAVLWIAPVSTVSTPIQSHDATTL